MKENDKIKEVLKDKDNEIEYQEDMIKFFNITKRIFLSYNMHRPKVRKKGL